MLLDARIGHPQDIVRMIGQNLATASLAVKQMGKSKMTVNSLV